MAKMYGLQGVLTGKIANTVLSVRNGEQIARKYQPVVFNPSTAAQVAQRAKMKLMSQMSAVMAPVIAMRKNGAVSSRNMFVKNNFDAVSYENDEAVINLMSIKLTDSVISLPPVIATRNEFQGEVQLSGRLMGFSRVVYCFFSKQADKTLRYAGSEVVSEAGVDGKYTTSHLITEREFVVYAYAVRLNSDAATAKFGNMEVATAEEIASLVVTRTLSETDVSLSETQAVTIPARE